MVAGIDRWEPSTAQPHEPRLERRLRVNGFRVPPAASESGPDIPVVRFPTWAHCPSCKRLDRYDRLTSIFKNAMQRAAASLSSPAASSSAVAKGHIDDFPYFNWVHAGSPRTDGEHRMTIDSAGDTASLGDIVIRCTCGETRRPWTVLSTGPP